MTSIRGALRRQIVGGLLVMLGLTGGGLYLFVRRQLTADFDAALAEKVRVLAGLMKQERDGVELELGETPMPEFERAVDPEYFEVWLGDAVFLRAPALGVRDLPRATAFADLALPDGRRGRRAGLRFAVRAEGAVSRALPPATLVVARGRASLDRSLRSVALALLAAGVVLLAGVPLVVARGVRRGLRPLDELAAQATAIDAHASALRFRTDGLPAELHPIAARLNDLLDRLFAAFARERRFSADVAHELRTPLAELRTLAEVALQDPPSRAFEDVLAATLQMERLVTTLLTLARCEAGRQPVTLAPVSLARALDEAWAPLAARARAKSLAVTAKPCAVSVVADPLLLGSILGNLLGNAVEYAPAGGFVRWGLANDELVIANSNDTLAPADLPHVFEPFWRKDPARSDGAHGGLGLALVAAFARLIGAEARLELGPAGEVRVRLSLRRAEPGPAPASAA